MEITVHYANRVVKEQHMETPSCGRSVFTPFNLTALSICCLLIAGGLFAWRMGEVNATLRHRRTMQQWVRTHPAAARFVPKIQSRPLVAAAVLALAGLGVAAGLMAYAERKRFNRRHVFTLGETGQCSVPLSISLLPCPCFPLIEAVDAGFHLQYSKAMQGALELPTGDVLPLSAPCLASAKNAHAEWPETWTIDIPAGARFWVRIGPLSITGHDALRNLQTAAA
jgi:hypothetical protein